MSAIKKRFTKQEKLEIIKMSLDEGKSVEQVAAQFGIHTNTLYTWRSQLNKHTIDAFPGSGTKLLSAEQRENELLRKQLRERELEIEILKKAVGIFSSPNKRNLLS